MKDYPLLSAVSDLDEQDFSTAEITTQRLPDWLDKQVVQSPLYRDWASSLASALCGAYLT